MKGEPEKGKGPVDLFPGDKRVGNVFGRAFARPKRPAGPGVGKSPSASPWMAGKDYQKG